MNPQKRRRDRLFSKKPFCYWCNCQLIHPRRCKVNGVLPKIPPDNMATIDHLDNKLSPERGNYNHQNVPRTVLACHKCNQLRGRQEVEAAEMKRRAQAVA